MSKKYVKFVSTRSLKKQLAKKLKELFACVKKSERLSKQIGNTKGIIKKLKLFYRRECIEYKFSKLYKEEKRLGEKLEKRKPIPFKTLQDKWEAERKWDKKHPNIAKLKVIWWWIRHGIWNKIEETPRNIKYFIQRGKRGYSDCDVWGFDHYLTRVISEGIDKLIKNLHGHPCELENIKEWKIILKKISKTFKTAIKIQDGKLRYMPITEYTDKQRKNYKYLITKINKKLHHNDRIMTKKENKEYEDGWKQFQRYFFGLWD